MKSSPIPLLERPAFFDGQRLTAADLSEASGYSVLLRRLHNRALHGWGVVLGLAVTGARGARSVQVSPGLALDCTGRELLLPASTEIAVPPVAEAGDWFLVVSGVDDADLPAADERAGVCGTEGAVRLDDEPLVRWLAATGKGEAGVRFGYDVVLAKARIRACKLDDDVDLSARQQLPDEQPYVAAGQTPVTTTSWKWWPSNTERAGVVTKVSTAEAGFRTTPSYQARLGGDRQYGADVYDGIGHIFEPSATSFEFCVVLPTLAHVSGASAGALNPDLSDDGLPSILGGDLNWRVVWMGVEIA
ncbi:MAG: hypothetical protein ACXVZ4_14480 [Gaiellaceae bacterium]